LGWKAELFRCPERYLIFDIDAEVIAAAQLAFGPASISTTSIPTDVPAPCT
jgi:hypothetical protein